MEDDNAKNDHQSGLDEIKARRFIPGRIYQATQIDNKFAFLFCSPEENTLYYTENESRVGYFMPLSDRVEAFLVASTYFYCLKCLFEEKVVYIVLYTTTLGEEVKEFKLVVEEEP